MPKANITRRGGAVRLTLSAGVANDLGALKRSLKLVAERLGHPACATGCDILHMGLEQEFSLGDAVQLNPQPLPPRSLGLDQAMGADHRNHSGQSQRQHRRPHPGGRSGDGKAGMCRMLLRFRYSVSPRDQYARPGRKRWGSAFWRLGLKSRRSGLAPRTQALSSP